MSKSKVNMPKELKRKCNIIIHSATGASAVAGLIPIPMSDAIPIIHTRKAIPLNSEQKKRIGFD